MKSKSDAPICLDYYRPDSPSIPLQFMQIERRDIQIFDCLCLIELGKNQTNSSFMPSLDAWLIVKKDRHAGMVLAGIQ
jgi:hypothetical protein